MKLYLFNKLLRDDDLPALVTRAQRLGVDGYHLCVRPGYSTDPENVERTLPELVAGLRREGLAVPMATSRSDLILPEAPDARPLLRALDHADVRLLKIGYFRFPRSVRLDYAAEADRARAVLNRWQELAREYRVKICYQSHASCGDYFLGSNAAAVLSLMSDLDPSLMGVYLDAGHLAVEGEPFDLAAAITRPYLAAVALKDARWIRPKLGEQPVIAWERAGEGTVDWACVGRVLTEECFVGPVTIHAEYEAPDTATALAWLPDEVAFFRRQLSDVSAGHRGAV